MNTSAESIIIIEDFNIKRLAVKAPVATASN